MSDAPIAVCPRCKKREVEKLLSTTAFQLKGGGWYKDGYTSSKPEKSSKTADKSGG